ncbi:MAG: DUF4905 domain-containing protein [Ignavibacteria bacterium]|nr:DUF4905 domain-containing protein [Ignavibacteria bacterium]
MLGRNKIKPLWKFSQKGNLWKFIFAGNKYIAGETRDITDKTLYLFSIRISDGRKMLSDFKFDNGNYWISVEAANEKSIFLSRFENPELPYPKNIISLDIRTGEYLWENTDYVFYFCTENMIYGYKRKFETVEYAELDPATGMVKRVIPETENPAVTKLKTKSDEDLFSEFHDYPKSNSAYPPVPSVSELIDSEINGKEINGEIEYILKKDKLIFNYYVKTAPDMKDLTRNCWKNIFCIYDIVRREKIFGETLNERSSYNVPDNFFSRGDYVFYLVGKKELKAIFLK